MANDAHNAAVWGDFNGDRYLDLYVGGYENPNYQPDAILINNRDGTFSKAWQTPAGQHQPARGITSADFDQDGDIDVYVSNYRLEPNLLWRNNGAGTFTNVAASYNAVATSPGYGGGHSVGAAFGDLDNDGLIDLFAGNFAHSGQPQSRFLRNQGPAAGYRFRDMGPAGVYWKESYVVPTLGDFDNDGNLDLFFTTVYSGDTNTLFRNTGGSLVGNFLYDGDLPNSAPRVQGWNLTISNVVTVTITPQVGRVRMAAGAGESVLYALPLNLPEVASQVSDDAYTWVLTAEVNDAIAHDLAAFDLITGVSSGSAGYRDRLFIEDDQIRLSGLAADPGFSTTMTPNTASWTTMLAENVFRFERGGSDVQFFVNDDLVFKGRGGGSSISSTQVNLGNSNNSMDIDWLSLELIPDDPLEQIFTDVSATAGLPDSGTYQSAWADFDNDGDLDLIAGTKIFRNTATGNHFLKVSLDGNGVVNGSGIGAQVRLQLGDDILTRQVEGAIGPGNQNDHTLHFGLGGYNGPIELEIIWPDATTQMVNTFADEFITVRRVRLAGDMNNDLTIDDLDIDALRNAVSEMSTDLLFDVNGDAQVDSADVTYLIATIIDTSIADVNLDHRVDAMDLEMVRQNMGATVPAGIVPWGWGNLVGNNQIDDIDLLAMRHHFGFDNSLNSTGPPTPEPASAMLLGLAVIVLADPLRCFRAPTSYSVHLQTVNLDLQLICN